MLKHKKYTYGPENAERKILVICGTHGNETNAILSTLIVKELYAKKGIDLINENMNRIPTRITFLVGWNEPAIALNQREYEDTTEAMPDDLNRAFSDNEPIESKTTMVRRIEDEIAEHDIVIDIHNSPHIKNSVLINADLYAEKFVKFCTDNDIFCILNENSNPTIKYYGIRKGKFALTVELDAMGFTNDCNSKLNDNANFIIDLLKAIVRGKKTDFEIGEPSKVVFAAEFEAKQLTAHTDGYIAYQLNDPMRSYKKGDVIAHINNYDGEVLENIVAPCDGCVCNLGDGYIAEEGGFVALFQPYIKIEK